MLARTRRKYGFLGAGTVAQTVSRHLLQAGHEVVLSNRNNPDRLQKVVSDLGKGAHAGSIEEAAVQEMVVLAVPWRQIEQALSSVLDWTGRILIDTTNRFEQSMRLGDISGQTSSEIVARLAPGARVVKAFNNVPMDWIQDYTNDKPKTVLFLSGDDKEVKTNLKDILEAIGFAVVDLGTLAHGGRLQQVGGPLAGLNLELRGQLVIK